MIYTGLTWGFPYKSIFGLAQSSNGSEWSYPFSASYKSGIPEKIAAGGPYYVFPLGVYPQGEELYYTTDPGSNLARVTLSPATRATSYTDVTFGNNVFVAVVFGSIYKSNPVTGSAPLRIIQQPASASLNVGGTVVFSVVAQGSDPVTYQWRKDGEDISGETSRSLTLTDVAIDSAGEYDVVITNPAGSITSDKAILRVQFADLRFYAGLTLRGNVGDTFKIEYRDEIETGDEWRFITDITLTSQQWIWFDPESADNPNRFYRATFLGL